MSEIEPRASISPEEARGLTNRARDSYKQTAVLFLATYESGAWDALGYSSWLEYAIEEFQVSRPRAYQMLNHAEIVREVIGSSSTMVDRDQLPNERQTRELGKVPEGQRAEVWQKVVEITDGKPTAAAIREAVQPEKMNVVELDPFSWRCPADPSHVSLVATVDKVGGCPYCLRTPEQRMHTLQEERAAQRTEASRLDPFTPLPAPEVVNDERYSEAVARVEVNQYMHEFLKQLTRSTEFLKFSPGQVAELASNEEIATLEHTIKSMSEFMERVIGFRKSGLRMVKGGKA